MDMRRIASVLLVLCGSVAAQDVGKIAGTVIDATTRQPIPKVHIGSVTGEPGSGAFVGVLTGPDGGYVLENVPAGLIRMTVNLEGYKFIADPPGRALGWRLSPGETARRDFVLHRRSRIYGHLTDRDSGKAIEGHAVIAMRMDARPGATAYLDFASTKKGDQFEIPELDAGLYYLQIETNAQPVFVFSDGEPEKPAPEKVYGQSWYPGVTRMDQAIPIRLGEGENRAVDIALAARETHSVSGMVEAPREMAGQPLTLMLQRSGYNGSVAAMKAPGSFRIDNLPPGSYRLDVLGGAPADSGTQNLRDYIISSANRDRGPAVNAVGSAEFEIGSHDIDHLKVTIGPYGGVAGEVKMLEEDGKLPAGFGVLLSPAGSWASDEIPPAPGAILMIRVSQVADGRFHPQGLMPGDYWPRANNLPPGYAVTQVLVGGLPSDGLVAVDTPETPITLVLTSRAGAVAGVVHDSDQNPVTGATVVLFPEPLTNRTDRARIVTQVSSKGGSFAFRDLAPGRYHAVALTDADAENEGTLDFLRKKAEGTETIEVAAGKTAAVELKR